jgi:hypothetical protein
MAGAMILKADLSSKRLRVTQIARQVMLLRPSISAFNIHFNLESLRDSQGSAAHLATNAAPFFKLNY